MNRILVMIAMAAALGCSTESRGTRVMIDAETGDATVVENSYRLSNRIEVGRITYGEVDGLKKATVTLKSKTKRRQRIQARMAWLDDEGTEIDPDGKPFRAIVIDGNDMVTFTGVAPNARGKTAKMMIREMDTVE